MELIESFEELVERAFYGDSVAFDHLYHFLHRYLTHFLNDHHAAEDVVQETLEKVWKDWRHSLRNRSKMKSWMFQIAHNATVDYLRKKRGSSTVSLDRLEDPDSSPIREYIQLKRPEEIPEQYIELLEDARFVQWALSQIPEPSRSSFILKVFEKWKLKDIADIHQCSTRQVQRYIEDARYTLRQICERVLVERHLLERSSDL